jgi:hypothetical protein
VSLFTWLAALVSTEYNSLASSAWYLWYRVRYSTVWEHFRG